MTINGTGIRNVIVPHNILDYYFIHIIIISHISS
jgi:hypothetical protein